MSNSRRKFQKTATQISYYGTWNLKWWQKPFFNAPKTYICEERNTRSKAEYVRVPAHKQFGKVFDVAGYTSEVRRVR